MNIISCNEHKINYIIDAYENGKIIAFPTDTVYGVGYDPFNKDSISRIYDLKKRQGEKRFPILGSSKKELEKIVEFLNITTCLVLTNAAFLLESCET